MPDFVLGPATPASGTVRWSDGRPVVMATVQAVPQNARTLHSLHAPGTCRLFDASGAEHSDRFGAAGREGAVGELLPYGGNQLLRILPPGTYALRLDFGALGLREQQVVIRAREISELRLRL